MNELTKITAEKVVYKGIYILNDTIVNFVKNVLSNVQNENKTVNSLWKESEKVN